MSVVQTSLLAYHSLERVGAKQKACYRIIKEHGPCANYDIAKWLQWEINRVTPRVKELREMEMVEEAYKNTHPATHRTVIYWRIKE